MPLINTLPEFQNLAQTISNGNDAVEGIDPATVPADLLDNLNRFMGRLLTRATVLGDVDTGVADADLLAELQTSVIALQAEVQSKNALVDALRDKVSRARQELRLLNPEEV